MYALNVYIKDSIEKCSKANLIEDFDLTPAYRRASSLCLGRHRTTRKKLTIEEKLY